MKLTVENAKAAGFSELKSFALKLKIKAVGVKTEDLRANVIAAIAKETKETKHPVKTETKAEKPEAKTETKTEPKKETKPFPKATSAAKTVAEVSKADLKTISTLATKKEKILKLNELGYKAGIICNTPGIEQHVTNVLACLRANNLGTGKKISKEVRDRIRATVVAKLTKTAKAKR